MHNRIGQLSSTSWVTSLVRRTVMLRKLSGGPHCRVHRCESQRMLHLVRPSTGGCSARNGEFLPFSQRQDTLTLTCPCIVARHGLLKIPRLAPLRSTTLSCSPFLLLHGSTNPNHPARHIADMDSTPTQCHIHVSHPRHTCEGCESDSTFDRKTRRK